jgi:hypothetical protein
MPGSHTRYARPPAFAVAVVAGLAVLVASCGSKPSPGTAVGAPDPHQPAAATVETAATAAAAAKQYGRHLLASLRLPPGARVTGWPAKPIGALQPATRPAIGSDYIDLPVWFHVGVGTSDLRSYLVAHLPAGTSIQGNGDQGSTASGTLVPSFYFVTFTPRTLPTEIFSATLVTTFLASRGGGSLLRADAQVAWFPRRTAPRINPALYKSVTVSWTITNPQVSPPPAWKSKSKVKTFTSRSVVATAATLVNALNAEPDVSTSCPGAGGPGYKFTFNPAGLAPTIVVTPTDCDAVSMTVNGRQVQTLYPPSQLNSMGQQLLRHQRVRVIG